MYAHPIFPFIIKIRSNQKKISNVYVILSELRLYLQSNEREDIFEQRKHNQHKFFCMCGFLAR